MIAIPWGQDRCPCCGAEGMPRWWKLYTESRACPACGSRIELSAVSRSIRGGICIALGTTLFPLGLVLVADFDWRALALVAATVAAVAWILTWLPLTETRGEPPQAPESLSVPWTHLAVKHFAAATALAALAAGFLIAATSFELPGQVLVLILLGVGILVGLLIGLFFDLPLGAALSVGDRLVERLSWPNRPLPRRLLRKAVRLAIVAALLFAFLGTLMLFG